MPEAVDPAPVPTAPEQGFFSSARSLDGLKPGEMLYPPSRVINFTSNFAIETVITHLRNAWNIQPHQVAPESTRERVADALGKWHRLSPEEKAALPRYPDKNEVDTPWRLDIYQFYAHVFADVQRSLMSMFFGMGHFHPPNTTHLVIPFVEDGPLDLAQGKVVKKWETHVLLAWAHLEDGVEVRMSRMLDGEEKTLETFTAEKKYEVAWLNKGEEVTFHIEGAFNALADGVAAVFAVGALHDGERCGPEGGEEEDDAESGTGEQEVV